MTTAPFAELFLDGVGHGVLPTPRNARGEIQETQWAVRGAAAGAAAAGGCGGDDVGTGLGLDALDSTEVAYSRHGHGHGHCGGPGCTGVGSFPINATGVQCHGLQRGKAGDDSADACAKLCCARGLYCDTWQLETSDGGVCWAGLAGEGVGKCGPPRQGAWVGGQRHTVPAPPPSPPAPPAPPYRNATLVAYSADPGAGEAKVLATHTLFAPSADTTGHRLQLTIDVPSASTGTGNTLLLDGRDVALVRCAVVDSRANDALVASSTARITWAVKGGTCKGR